MLNTTASIRAIATVVNVEATSYDVLVDHTDVGAGWATESSIIGESDTPQIDPITMQLHELSALPKASQRLLDDSAFDIEGWLAGRIADKFARAEAGVFINGDGIDKPKGFLAHTTVDNDVWVWGNLGYVPTGVSGDITPDSIVEVVYALGAQYRANASFVMNSKTACMVRKLKDMDGRFLWSDGLAAGEPARLMGYPVLTFRMRNGLRDVALDPERFAVSSDLDGTAVQVPEADAALSGRVRLRFIQADASYDVISEEAVLPDEETHAVAATEFTMLLTRAEGRQVAERWLNEARIAREAVQFALPPSQLPLRAGDVVSLPADQGEGSSLFRIDRVDQAEFKQIEAVRIDPAIYTPSPLSDELVGMRAFVAPVPVYPLFLDIPLLTGDEVPHAPHIAASANPWPGSVALYSSLTEQNFDLNTILPLRATIGTTRSPMLRASAGLIDRGDALEVRLISGRLETVDEDAMLSGANLAAIGDGSSGNWEIFQFASAQLIGPRTYLLRNRLRGQAGSDGLMPDVRPEGSQFVLLDSVPQQIDLSRNLRRVEQTYRIGPAQRPVSDPSYRQVQRAFDGNGLRPYAPAHLRGIASAAGAIALDWVRRTRTDGDAWEPLEVPLGEDSEAYLLRVVKDGVILREETLSAPTFSYGFAAQTADGAVAPFVVEVAQISATYRAGLFASTVIT